ncbi:MAG: phosphatidate cytidylyltransferase [Bacteroidetes bacterium]|nr:MAG: phosphatidate cytidylyltransferase [Bacteroidota bacterium]
MKFKDILKRAITGFIFLIVLISSILYSPYTLTFIFLVVLILGNAETNRMISIPTIHPQLFLSGVLTKLVYLLPVGYFLGLFEFKWILLVLIPLIFIPIVELFRNLKNPMANIAYSILPSTYLGIPLAALIAIAWHDGVYNPYLVLGLFIVIWVYDTGAYLLGTMFGKHKLFERISPKKTWEGAIGGGIVAVLTATFVLGHYIPHLSAIQWLIASVLIVVFGTFGDLMESMLKRSAGVKDSGNILPGHGGILDRFDSAFTASVVFWLYLQFI